MTWWAWLAIAWLVIAVVGAVGLGMALRVAERRDWIRRGRPGPPGEPRRDDAAPVALNIVASAPVEPNIVGPAPVFSNQPAMSQGTGAVSAPRTCHVPAGSEETQLPQ